MKEVRVGSIILNIVRVTEIIGSSLGGTSSER